MRACLLALFSLLLFNTPAVAQRECSSSAYNEVEVRNNPSLLSTNEKIESFIQNRLLSGTSRMSPSGTSGNGLSVIKIPVIVHILYNTEEQRISPEQVRSQIDAMNRNFRMLNAGISTLPNHFKAYAADCFIEFELATTDPGDKPTSGIIWKKTSNAYFGTDDDIKFSNKGGDDAWDADRYFNIWVGKLSPGNIGYSSLPGNPKDKDGIVIRYDAFGTNGAAKAPYDLGVTTVHETGHWLGVKHIWGDRFCGDDGIADTPPQRGATPGCPSGIINACNNATGGVMYMNFMDLTHDACANMFTNNQRDRMRAMFADGGPRHSLLFSNANAGTPLPVESPVDSIPLPVASLYPNPSAQVITVDTRNFVGEFLFVMNRLGQVVIRQRIVSERMSVRVSALKNGMYFIKIGQRGVVHKFVKAG